MLPTYFSKEQLKSFDQDGYLIVKNFCNKQEVDMMYCSAIRDKDKRNNALELNGLQHKKPSISQWFTPENDIFGYFERSEKVIHSIAQLLNNDSPVCHIHSKLMEKKPRTGGVWEWHQDFAYWQANNFQSADQIVSIMVALTPTNRANGCSQIIKGSHKLETLDHSFEGDEVGADKQVVNEALQTMEMLYPELETGDALFFHSNLLHRSDANLSGFSAWYNISCYSSQSNLADKQIFTSWHTPVQVVPDKAIIEWGNHFLTKDIFHKNGNKQVLNESTWKQVIAIS